MENVDADPKDETSFKNKSSDNICENSEEHFSCFDPRSSLHRYLILVFLCIAGFGEFL